MQGVKSTLANFIIPRLLVALVAVIALPELAIHFFGIAEPTGPGMPLLHRALDPYLAQYVEAKAFLLENWFRIAGVLLVLCVVLLLAARRFILVWHNKVLPWITGARFERKALTFPVREVDLGRLLTRRPAGMTLVGMAPPKGPLRPWKPVYLSERQRSGHRHVLGRTGSGKTQSVLLPQVLQDALDGKGSLFVDGKGSDENRDAILAIARGTGREKDVRVFSLPAWNQPQLFSHTYNPLHVTPRGPGPDKPGGDPAVVAERVFAILPLGDNAYYNGQAQLMFTNLCRLLHGIVDDSWLGIPFTMRDIGVCLKGVGSIASREGGEESVSRNPLDEVRGDRPKAKHDGWGEALQWCLETSKDVEAREEIESQVRRLGRKAHETFSGLVGAVDTFSSPIVNAYDPDIVFEDVLQKNRIVYVQLPGNMFKVQAPALGRVVLMDVQQQGALRQVFRTRNQAAFSVVVDEFGRFADRQFIDSLNQLRDANLQFTIAHQSLADLELVSREFAIGVWDNTSVKDVLRQDNPALCEMLAKSIGTEQVVMHTVRQTRGPFFTQIQTQESATKLVDAYRLHPNQIKQLARCGQGYLYTDEGITPVCYPMFPASARMNYALPKNDQTKARGLRLHERFVAGSRGRLRVVERNGEGVAP